MCGICGIVALERPPEVDTVEAMARELDHRGPDGPGSFAAEGVALGFRRLAIIDLSDAGDQPFASEDGTLQLVHNGEVYNYRELRRELEAHGHRFRSATDTEVILAAYREWGERCVERFNGMWAFALWDGPRRRLFASRDRFGVKPFYYSLDGGRLAFASEPRAFRADPATRLEPNPRAVREYLEQAFLDPVRLRLRSDVPLGTALSGGIDSSAIAVCVDHLLRTEAESAVAVGSRQRTFTAYFDDPGFDERPYAEAVVEQTRAEPHWISFSDEELVADLPRIVEAQGEPFGSTSICAGWYVMREAKRSGLTVMLDGQGGDEVLAGYRAHLG